MTRSVLQKTAESEGVIMEEKVKEAILNLSWNAPQCKQQEAIDFLTSIPEKYYPLLLRENSKKVHGKMLSK